MKWSLFMIASINKRISHVDKNVLKPTDYNPGFQESQGERRGAFKKYIYIKWNKWEYNTLYIAIDSYLQTLHNLF